MLQVPGTHSPVEKPDTSEPTTDWLFLVLQKQKPSGILTFALTLPSLLLEPTPDWDRLYRNEVRVAEIRKRKMDRTVKHEDGA